ncbi:sporulation protein YpjB [Paenibacillus sp. CAA11]|uniref:sporulation protein YpjB n=1 Tax=Paenibacillus sp. CAA11 TaxID=1532905 RepID=UPI00131F26D5|nr:sporulation protein YpjB [Paenibacillus sp. CAA11]
MYGNQWWRRLWRAAISTLALLISLLVTVNGSVYAAEKPTEEQQRQADALDQAAEEFYQHVTSQDLVKALESIQKVLQHFKALSYEGLTQVEGIHALAECVMDARLELTKASPSMEALEESSARLRLAADSLAHSKGALWQQYYKILTDDLEKIGQASLGGSGEKVASAVRSFKLHYERIRPAAVIVREPSEISMVDAWVSRLEAVSEQFEKGSSDEMTGIAEQGTGVIAALFGKAKETTVMLPIKGYSNPWIWTLFIGGGIGIALAYTAYRKYDAEKRIRPI